MKLRLFINMKTFRWGFFYLSGIIKVGSLNLLAYFMPCNFISYLGLQMFLNVYDLVFYSQLYWNTIRTNCHDNVLMVSKR